MTIPTTVACEITWRDEPDNQYFVTIALSEEVPNIEDDDDIFFYAGEITPEMLKEEFSEKNSCEDWYIINIYP